MPARDMNILDGMNVVDIAEAVDGYNYYGFLRHNGNWAIMREKTDGTEYRFAIGADSYTTAWTNKATQNYKYGTIGTVTL